jgi:hypothetical protein
MDRVTIRIRLHTEEMVRAFCFFFFIGVWTLGGILLTPELTSKSLLLPQLQFTIAICLLWRRTLPVSALGIAAYLALRGLQKTFFGIEPIDIMRYATAPNGLSPPAQPTQSQRCAKPLATGPAYTITAAKTSM